MKYMNRLSARLALAKLAEAKNAWIVSKDMSLKTEAGALDLKKGAIIEMYATVSGKLAVKESGVTVILDDDIASEIADNTVSAKDLGDVEFVKKSALDAALDNTSIEELVNGLADNEDEESDEVERAEISTDEKESVQAKFARLESGERISEKDALYCEEAEIADEPDSPIDLGSVEADTVNKEEIADYEEFKNRIAEFNGAIQPGAKELALNPEGKVVGYFDTEAGNGVIYPDCCFDSEEDMNNFSDEPEALVQAPEFATEACAEEIEEALKAYEESDKLAEDYSKFTESLVKAGLEESVIGKIANTFVSRNLAEGTVVVSDSKFGKAVRAFKENAEANNWIADTKEEARFSKKFVL